MTNLLTITDLAKHLQIGKSTAYALKADIGYVQIGGAVRFRPEDVEQYLASRLRRRGPPRPRIPRPKLKILKI